MPEPHARYTLGDWTFLPTEQLLIDPSNRQIALERRTAAVLRCLAEAEGRLVRRDDLLRSAWEDVVVSDDSLYRCISQLRKTFADATGRTPSVVTVRGQGYRLVIEESETTPPVGPAVRTNRTPKPSRSRTVRLAVAAVALLIAGLGLFRLAGPLDSSAAGERSPETPGPTPLLSLAFIDSLDTEALATAEFVVETDTADVEALLGSVSMLRPGFRWSVEEDATD